MNEVMEQCELSLGDSGESSKFALEDLGLTLSPGSQSQSFAHTMDFSQFDLSMDLDLGLMDNFDPLTDFDPIVHQIDIPTLDPTPAKRPLEEVSPNEAEMPTKRSCQSVPSPSLESLAMQTQSRMDLANRASPMVSANDFSVAGSSNPASVAAMTRFGLDPHDTADPIPTIQRTVPFLSPYKVSKYYPSAPFLHNHTVNVEVSSSALQHRLKNSQRRINVLVIERNRYRDKLLSYSQPDPRTGKLKIDEMEAEITTLRRVTSTQQTRARNLKTELQNWQNEYTNLARTHNNLLADYRASQKSPTLPSRQSPESTWGASEPWKGAYDQLLAEHRSLISALKTPGVDPMQVLDGLGTQFNKAASTNYPSPASISSMSNRPPAVPHHDAVVIDLTDDGAEDVSTLGFPTVQISPPANEAQLTDFRHALRHKTLDWIREPLDVRLTVQSLFDNISPPQGSAPGSGAPSKKRRGLLAPPPEPRKKNTGNNENSDVVSPEVSSMQGCERINLQVRCSLVMPSSSTATEINSSPTPASNVQLNTCAPTSISSFDSLFDEEPKPATVSSIEDYEALADSCFDNDQSLFMGQLAGIPDERHDASGEEDYHPDDDELARMIEEELAR
jgi:hypothetical protein